MKHQTIYIHKTSGTTYPLAADGKTIDIKNPIQEPLDMSKYKKTGGNNVFAIYELKKQANPKR